MRLIQNSRPVPQLLVLCRKYGVDAPDDVSPENLNNQLQQRWFKEGFLRYQIKGDAPNEEDRESLRELGFIIETPPPVATLSCEQETGADIDIAIPYAGVLLLGALRSRIVSRLHYFAAVAPNLLFRRDWKVSLFGGARPLDPVKESREVLCTPFELPFKEGWTPPEKMPATEAGMMEFTWQQSQLPLDWQYELVNAPLQPKPDGSTRPPNTGDTVKEWLTRHQPRPGYYLALSNQPFVEYQQLVLQRLLSQGFTVYACGPKSSLTLPLATYLDNIAKQLYEELQAS